MSKRLVILFMAIAAILLALGACADDLAEVPDGMPALDFANLPYVAQSEFAFAGYAELLNMVYAEVDGRQLRFDIFFPTEQKFERAPLVVGFHGGGWMAGDRSELTQGFAPIVAELRANGYAFATVEYRFANAQDIVFPAPLGDAYAFVRYIKENAGLYNIDPGNIGVLGYSAGAHLAMMLAYSTYLDISYVVSFAGPTKMFGDDPAGYPRATLMMVENFFGGTYEQLPELYRQGSPYYHLGRDRRVPILLVHDRADAVVPFSQAEQMFERAAGLGIDSELLEISGVGHDIEFASDRVSGRYEIMGVILDFIYRNHEN